MQRHADPAQTGQQPVQHLDGILLRQAPVCETAHAVPVFDQIPFHPHAIGPR